MAAVAAVGGVAANVFASFLYDHWGKKPATPDEVAANGQLRRGVAEAIRGVILVAAEQHGDLLADDRRQLRAMADKVAEVWPVVEELTMQVVVAMSPENIPVRVTDCFQRRNNNIATVPDWQEFLRVADSEAGEKVIEIAATALHTNLIPYLTTYLATGDGAADQACKKLTFRLLARLVEFADNAEVHLTAIRQDQREILAHFRGEVGPILEAMAQHGTLIRQDIELLGGRVDMMLGLVAVGQLRGGAKPARKEAERFVRELRNLASDVVVAKNELARYVEKIDSLGSIASANDHARAADAKMLLLALTSDGKVTRRVLREHRNLLATAAVVLVIGGTALWWKLQRERSVVVEKLDETKGQMVGELHRLGTVVTDLSRELKAQKREVSELSDDEYMAEISRRTGWSRQRINVLLAAANRSRDKSIQADALFVKRKTEESYRLSIEAGEEKLAATQPLLVEAARDFLRAGNAKMLDRDYRRALVDLGRGNAAVEAAGGKEKEAVLWAEIRLRQADAMLELVVHTDASEGNRLTDECVAAYKDAMAAFNSAKEPLSWKTAQHNLALALYTKAGRVGSEEAVHLYQEAIDAYLFSLKLSAAAEAMVEDPELKNEFVQDRGRTLNNLGQTYLERSKRAAGADAVTLVAKAVDAHQKALIIRDREKMPWQWANSQVSLAVALGYLASLSAGEDSAKNYGWAISALKSAEEIFTREAYPEEWAGLQVNLGATLRDLAKLVEEKQAGVYCQEAVSFYEKALEVFTKEAFPTHWSTVLNNLGNIRQQQYVLSNEKGSESYLVAAVECYEKALEVRTKEHLPQDWSTTCNNLANASRKLGAATSGAESKKYLEKAIAYHQLALEVRTRKSMPQDWASSHVNIGNTRLTQADKAETGEEAGAFYIKAVEAYSAALEVQTREHMPQDWAQTEFMRGTAFYKVGLRLKRSDAKVFFSSAAKCLGGALEVVRGTAPGRVADTEVMYFRALCEVAFGTEEWEMAVTGFAKLAAAYPNERRYYESLAAAYHEGLHDFAKAHELHAGWLNKHETDVQSQIKFTETHFTTGRFVDCVARSRRLQNTRPREEITLSDRAVMQALEIAGLAVQERRQEAEALLRTLQAEIEAGDADFSVDWTWSGSRYFLEHSEEPGVVKNRERLLRLFDAMQASTRDAMVVKLKLLSLKIVDSRKNGPNESRVRRQ